MIELSKKPYSIVHSLTCLRTLNKMYINTVLRRLYPYNMVRYAAYYLFLNESGIYRNDIAHIIWLLCGKKILGR